MTTPFFPSLDSDPKNRAWLRPGPTTKALTFREVYEKFNPRHDQLGRFATADAGGSGEGSGGKLTGNLPNYTPAPASSATELFNRTYDANVTPDQVIDSVPGARAALAKVELANAKDTPTQELYLHDGAYDSARQAVHEDILANKIFTPEALAKAAPTPGEQPVFTVLGGRAGAGKSWFTSVDGPTGKNALVINSDDIKEALPEYRGGNAGLLHQESSDVVNMAHGMARNLGINVVFDATMRSTGDISKFIDLYSEAGYKIEGYFMHTAPQVSAVRALTRFLDTGRYVPPSYVLSSTTNEKSFDAMVPKMDRWAVYDNNSGNGPAFVVGSK